jgi:hypothetical protein
MQWSVGQKGLEGVQLFSSHALDLIGKYFPIDPVIHPLAGFEPAQYGSAGNRSGCRLTQHK